ncbi:ribonuclease E/G [Glacieibacterium frigidum]|uniref:Ribonuclease n=1 Tax=Glacieibacterium frigidum TaxID=2593303 RepID=A0A552U9A5_9SPHN|nr:ribonuclease E/G [Glacieibacterium frigidum]TRW14807.1 ribonuclease [Glacieibacterium frigidum]
MSEALIDHGIGETRAVVIEDGEIVEAHVERDDDGLRAGDVWAARLVTILVPGRRGIVECGGHEALLEPLPSALTSGGLVRVEVVREALPEAGRAKLAKVRAVPGALHGPGRIAHGPDLAERLSAAGHKVRDVTHSLDDPLEPAGWGEVAEAAASGHVAFAGGLLTISPTPAMTVIDVDGAGEARALAEAAAVAAAQAIRCFDLAGSIGIDFPTLGDKAARTALGELLDAALAAPFERTAVNGFGFVQIVRPRLRASLVERLRLDAVPTAALTLLRHAVRTPGAGTRELAAAPSVVAWLEARPHLVDDLRTRSGRAVRLRADPGLAISGGHVAAL